MHRVKPGVFDLGERGDWKLEVTWNHLNKRGKLFVCIIVIFSLGFWLNGIPAYEWMLKQSPESKPSSEGFEGQASGCEKAEKPRDEGS